MPRPPPGLTKALYEAWLYATEPAALKGSIKHLPRGNASSYQATLRSVHVNRLSSAPTRVSADSATHPLGKFLRSITDGVFKDIKSSSYNHPHGPYSSSRLGPKEFPPRPVATRSFTPRGRSQQFTFGPAPRPIVLRNTGQNVGLSSARNFSSAGPGVFANVISNAPLGLRALADELREDHSSSGLDAKRWAHVRRAVRTEMKREALRERLHQFPRAQQTQLVAAQRDEAFLSRCEEFKQYFTSAISECLENPAAVTAVSSASTARLPIVLAIAAEPDFYHFGYDSVDMDDCEPSNWRVLSPSTISTLSAITSAHEQHARRIRALHNRLWAAGVFDPNAGAHIEADQWSPCGTRREVHVVFDPSKWDVRDVKSAVGEWHAAGTWYRIIDQQADVDAHTASLASLGSQTSEDASQDSYDEDIAETFVLPRVDLLRDSMMNQDCADDLASTHSSPLTLSLELSPPLSSYALSSLGEDENGDSDDLVDEAQREWQDAREEWQTQDVASVALNPLADSYEDGVHMFLKSLDDLSRGSL